ncbi:metal-sulfur cluster assembly factor [Bifidobacterium sp.]|jgi:metal-sulfur cluster biosynthetic enzyme|uniref:metal-sulfur cluster assembly factor n=1 Tax=Bifidobacterium sp. TaxID=41200 RepID=UPI0025C1E58E|nr:metal-sulfur cluster assembly factor [Bifidobacterium sp.]MCI1635828.1 metal-sulfur cluster assembly factor [Bifidobacterium sp.]
MTHSSLVPEPTGSILDSIESVVGSEDAARKVMANPERAALYNRSADSHSHANDSNCACGGSCGCGGDDDEAQIPIKALDDIGRATAQDVMEALHQVIDPELGIDVIDLGLVYGIEIDEQGRAIITMTLTTPACPLTDMLEDQCASVLAGLVEEFRIDWTWTPRWTMDMISPEGREQLAALGFNFSAMPHT